MEKDQVKFFATAAAFQKWLTKNHNKATELILGFHKKDSGKGGITYAEALDEALCHGWIDGVRRSLDATSYSVRFTPRKARSIWSHVNLAHVERLNQAGRMMPPGLKAHAARDEARVGIYSFENAPRKLSAADEARFKANPEAWKYFQSQPPFYRRLAIWRVTDAKKEETRSRRLLRLIDDSAHGRRMKEAQPAATGVAASGRAAESLKPSS